MGIVVCDVLMMGKEGTSGSGVCLQGAACVTRWRIDDYS